MISVILYGRNDAHGYNLHRRAALSFNCIAEVLTEPGDEIVFVDYNTPDELPTFVEALADTLTDRCLDLLRVFRVPAAVHARRFGDRTHLPALEPIARNAGVRRAHPANRWLLSTNTDMIFLPVDSSLSEICRDLADGFYGLPRFELPEWLWERLPRSEPRRAMAEIERLGPALRLDEPTVSHEWIRFDAPGDFQLILREDFSAIDGLDEEMILGYHVDSNLSRRMLFHRGSIETLGERVAAYHCNHNRERTVYHGAKIVANDLERFVVNVERAELPAQRDIWGLVDEELEEVALRERVGPAFAESLAGAIPPAPGPRTPSDAARVPYELTYDSGHVVPFVADALAVSSPGATIGYVGANAVMKRMLDRAVAQLWFESPLQTAALDDPSAVDDVVQRADVVVLDLGIDASGADPAFVSPGAHQPAPLPPELYNIFDVVERIVDLERERLERGERSTRFVLVHSWTVFWDSYVLANFDCSHTTAHSRVRRGTVRRAPADDGKTRKALAQERLLVRWAKRGEVGRHRLPLPVGDAVEPGRLRDYGGFGDGWAFPEEGGIWTQGSRCELALSFEGDDDGDHVLALTLGSICVPPESSLSAAALVNGERVAARTFAWGDPEWHIRVPASAAANGEVDLTFEIDEPRTPIEAGWSLNDERPLGLLFEAIEALPADVEAARVGMARERRVPAWAARGESSDRRLHLRPGETAEIPDLADYGGFREGWRLYPDQEAPWTEGSRSELALALEAAEGSDYVLTFALASICVATDGSLPVDALIDGEVAATRDFRYGDPEWRIEAPGLVPADGEIELTLSIPEPSSPRELGWSKDERRLGLQLRALMLDAFDRSVRPGEPVLFTEGSGADRLLGEGWSRLETTGVWTDGDAATLMLRPTPVPSGDAELVLDVEPFLTPQHRELHVEVFSRGRRLSGSVFRQRRGARLLGLRHRPIRVALPLSVRDDSGRVVLELRLRDPARPVDLGVSDDSRRLGLHLRSLTIEG